MNDFEKNSEIEEYKRLLDEKNERICALEKQAADLESKNSVLQAQYTETSMVLDSLLHSTSWTFTAPLRAANNFIKKGIHLFSEGNFRKVINSLKQDGLKKTLSKICQAVSSFEDYRKVQNRFIFSDEQLEKQRADRFSRDITISIVVPIYNTPENYLEEMIDSVRAQTYGKWELCLADGSDAEHSYVGECCRKYTESDSRITYRKLEKNLGISDNTNEAIALSTGEYIALFDHDDLLHPAALHEVMKAICEGDADFIYTDECTFAEKPEDGYLPHFKPDYAPDNLLANNYICHLTVFSRRILDAVGGFRSEYDGSQDHDFILRATAAAECVAHIPEVLYFWRAHPGSVASSVGVKPYAITAGRKAVGDHIRRCGRSAEVTSTEVYQTIYRMSYELESHPKISIIIPNCEYLNALKTCINSIYQKTTYDNFEVLIIENNSTSKEIFDYYELIRREHDNLKVLVRNGAFNFSAICNFGAANSSGEVLLFLNNDTEVITESWLEEMLMYAQRKDVAAVGAKLYFPNGAIQHSGVLLGCGGVAGHYFYLSDKDCTRGIGRNFYAQDQTAVTGACMMIRRDVFEEVGGFDEEYAVTFNDVDLCMRLRRNGYLNVWTPFAELYHYESLSRGSDETAEKRTRFIREVHLFQGRWSKELAYGDPYYNPNLEYERARFEYKEICLPHSARYVRKASECKS